MSTPSCCYFIIFSVHPTLGANAAPTCIAPNRVKWPLGSLVVTHWLWAMTFRVCPPARPDQDMLTCQSLCALSSYLQVNCSILQSACNFDIGIFLWYKSAGNLAWTARQARLALNQAMRLRCSWSCCARQSIFITPEESITGTGAHRRYKIESKLII